MSAVLTSKTTTTRKPHKCYGCARTFPAGSKMYYQAQVEGPYYMCFRMCMTCYNIYKIEQISGETEFPEYWIADNLPDGDCITPKDKLKQLQARK